MDIFLLSLGCSKNQTDSERLAGLLTAGGHCIVEDSSKADAAIVNTCGFIAPAVEESVDAILELEILKNTGEIKFLGVVGCLVNRFEEELKAELDSVDIWARAGDFEAVARFLSGKEVLASPMVLPGYPVWSRYLKISEGCDNRCSYCTIPMIRGALTSRPGLEILQEAEILVSGGAKEICLVGQDLTSYGADIGPGVSLAGLIDDIESRFRGEDLWFRLLYLHPSRVDRPLIEKIASSSIIQNYLDIPVQHVDPDILRSMNRKDLNSDRLREIFASARSVDPDFALRTTVMVGYPGESESQFRTLLGFLEEAEIDRVGVFPYYREEGTPAAVMQDQVSDELKMERIEKITSLQEKISLRRQKLFEGRIMRVLVEEVNYSEEYAEGRSFREAPEVDGVIEISTRDAIVPGEFANVRIIEALEHDLLGEVALS
ncbi:MAG: 30S ribosomal protein S12 methylthiotransferase RimO [Thermovirgaceae bacterium]|nr:30S ribosomal protein S12 methylthiotransferase RimO [Thermovirgaceae bacterium]